MRLVQGLWNQNNNKMYYQIPKIINKISASWGEDTNIKKETQRCKSICLSDVKIFMFINTNKGQSQAPRNFQ